MTSTDFDILLVEDDDDVREAIAEGLEDVGYHVRTAANGREALDMLLASRAEDGGATLPGLILLDLMMPMMDGWELHTQILKDPVTARIPVVVVSAAGFMDPNVALSRAVGFLRKPLDLMVLRETARRHCGPPRHPPR